MRQLEEQLFGSNRPDVVLFVHNIATRVCLTRLSLCVHGGVSYMA